MSTATENHLPYGKLITIDGWEMIITPPRKAGDLPSVTHALYQGSKWMDIEVKDPIKISFDTIGTDNHPPAIQFKLTIEIDKFQYRQKIDTDIWVECDIIDDFLDSICNGTLATMTDMSQNFELILDFSQKYLEWSLIKKNLDGYITTSRGKEKLTSDSLHTICSEFKGYPKWW